MPVRTSSDSLTDTNLQSHTVQTSPAPFDTTQASESLCLEPPSSGVASLTAKEEGVMSHMVSKPEWCVTNAFADDVVDVFHEAEPETRDPEQLSGLEHGKS